MSEPFLAEIRMLGFNFAPRGWAMCDGQILPINQNQSLYSLLGTTYGGDGRTSFALPDLRGRVPIHEGASSGGQNHPLGQRAGAETHTLSVMEMPQHNHTVKASNADGTTNTPTGNVFAKSSSGGKEVYTSAANLVKLAPGTVSAVGGGQSHSNMQPFITLNFCIALQGLFPSRN